MLVKMYQFWTCLLLYIGRVGRRPCALLLQVRLRKRTKPRMGPPLQRLELTELGAGQTSRIVSRLPASQKRMSEQKRPRNGMQGELHFLTVRSSSLE
jgi:hypothetical protein